MKFKIYLLLALVLILNCSFFAQKPEWFSKIKSVELLKSTREDIIKVFGQPRKKDYYFESFELKEATMDVEYSTALCKADQKEGWDVPEFTVTRIFLDFSKPINPKKMPIGLTQFRKYPIEDVPGAFVYENDELGISYSATPKDKIDGITFYPATKFKSLYCMAKM